jgi:hypothetical protein
VEELVPPPDEVRRYAPAPATAMRTITAIAIMFRAIPAFPEVNSGPSNQRYIFKDEVRHRIKPSLQYNHKHLIFDDWLWSWGCSAWRMVGHVEAEGGQKSKVSEMTV